MLDFNMKTHPITIHEESDSEIFKAPFDFRNLLAEILSEEQFVLNIKCSEEMIDNEEFEVELEFPSLGIFVVEMLGAQGTTRFECNTGEDFHQISDKASFWRWVAICGRKSLTSSQS